MNTPHRRTDNPKLLNMIYQTSCIIMLSAVIVWLRSDINTVEAIAASCMMASVFLTYYRLNHVHDIALARGHLPKWGCNIFTAWNFAAFLSIFFGLSQIASAQSPNRFLAVFLLLFTLTLLGRMIPSSTKSLEAIQNHETYDSSLPPQGSSLWLLIAAPTITTILWVFLSFEQERSPFAGSLNTALYATLIYIIIPSPYPRTKALWTRPSIEVVTRLFYITALIILYFT